MTRTIVYYSIKRDKTLFEIDTVNYRDLARTLYQAPVCSFHNCSVSMEGMGNNGPNG